jgi:hypothetical protein
MSIVHENGDICRQGGYCWQCHLPAELVSHSTFNQLVSCHVTQHREDYVGQKDAGIEFTRRNVHFKPMYTVSNCITWSSYKY